MRRSTREAKLKIAMKIMVFSGSVGPRPDCSFAFKFPINQSITELTVYGATVINKLNVFYRFFYSCRYHAFQHVHKLYTYFNFIAGINIPKLYMYTCAVKYRYL